MEGKRTSFVYLSEPELLKLGVTDEARCVEVSEEVFVLLSEGDYLMGGSNHNSHGLGIVFPKETQFPNMPVAGPDRRFTAMPAYLGGRFDICGVKWYGSNAANTSKGLPRSVLTLLLNDKDTGEPLCFMSANLISAMRTGAVPGVASKYLVKKDATVCSIIGCGPINQSCCRHILSQTSGISTVLCYDLFEDKAEVFAAWVAQTYCINACVVKTAKAAIEGGDIVSVAASRLKPLYLEYSWAKKGTTIMLSGPAQGDDDFWKKSTIILDSIGLHKAYIDEAVASGDISGYYSGVIGGPIYQLIDKHELRPLDESVDLGSVIRGRLPGRQNDDEIVLFIACGMAVFDLAWGYEMYQNALKSNSGQDLLVWE